MKSYDFQSKSLTVFALKEEYRLDCKNITKEAPEAPDSFF